MLGLFLLESIGSLLEVLDEDGWSQISVAWSLSLRAPLLLGSWHRWRLSLVFLIARVLLSLLSSLWSIVELLLLLGVFGVVLLGSFLGVGRVVTVESAEIRSASFRVGAIDSSKVCRVTIVFLRVVAIILVVLLHLVVVAVKVVVLLILVVVA